MRARVRVQCVRLLEQRKRLRPVLLVELDQRATDGLRVIIRWFRLRARCAERDRQKHHEATDGVDEEAPLHDAATLAGM